MKYFILFFALFTTVSYANEPKVAYRVDAYGNTRYDQPRLVFKGDRIYEANPYGQIQYHKGYVVLNKRPRIEVAPAETNRK
jgi:hypothetical protein